MQPLLVIFFLLFTTYAFAGSTQSNVSGSNTAIEGGYTGGSTTYESGSTSTTTSTNNSTSHIRSSPPTANAPSFSAQSQDVCATGASAGVQTFGLGISGGKQFRDMNCERIKLAKVLYDFGMKVGSVALLCQDERVFEAMINAGTPCPFEGKIGKEALEQWNKYDIERPDYDSYVSKLESRSIIDEELAEIAKQEEAKRIAEENAKKIAESKKEEIVEEKKIIIEKPVIKRYD